MTKTKSEFRIESGRNIFRTRPLEEALTSYVKRHMKSSRMKAKGPLKESRKHYAELTSISNVMDCMTGFKQHEGTSVRNAKRQRKRRSEAIDTNLNVFMLPFCPVQPRCFPTTLD